MKTLDINYLNAERERRAQTAARLVGTVAAILKGDMTKPIPPAETQELARLVEAWDSTFHLGLKL